MMAVSGLMNVTVKLAASHFWLAGEGWMCRSAAACSSSLVIDRHGVISDESALHVSLPLNAATDTLANTATGHTG
jgi:hypothetical protein